MFNSTSMTGTGLIAVGIVMALKFFGVVVPQDQILKLIADVIQDGGLIISIIGQVRRPDLHFGIIRKAQYSKD